MSLKYKITLAYDGTRYSGWQIQPNSVSIQGLIEEALQTLLRTSIRVIGAGRTDAGVHARGQVAHFNTENTLESFSFLKALNGMLPHDIRVKELTPAPEGFHAQYSAFSKEYHYNLWLEKVIDPFYHLYRHHFCYPSFSLDQLQEGASYFIGTHDFASFANVGGKVTSTVRTLTRLAIVPQEGGIRLEFEGNGFLYKMVRNIMGALLEIALGKRSPSQIPALLAAKDRRIAPSTAPAKGLFLIKVNY